MQHRIILSPEDFNGMTDLFTMPMVGDLWYHRGKQYRIHQVRRLANGGYDLVMK